MSNNFYIILLALALSVLLWLLVSLSYDYSTTLQMPIRVINMPDGYVTSFASSQDISLKVRGKGWNLLSIKIASQNEYSVDAGKDLKKIHQLDLKNFTAENSWLTSKVQILEILPDTISFSFEKAGYARLKIVPQLNLRFRKGYGLGSEISVIPESTTVFGPISLVNSTDQVPTEIFNLNELNEKTTENIPLRKLPGLEYQDKIAAVTLDVQRIVENSYDDISVNILAIPADRNVVLLPNKITVQLRGGIDVLGKLDKSKISAMVHYRDVVLDTIGSVVPHVDIPENTQLVNFQPEQLKYIIKKFNK